MNRSLIALVVLIILAVGGWYLYAHAPGNAPRLSADVYPLYADVTWGKAVATTSPDHGAVVMIQATAATNTMNIAAAVKPFIEYYTDKLAAEGYTQDMMEEASGPGANVSVYRKGDQFIVVSFSSLFHVRRPDAPVQCPCDVTLTLMSGTQVGPTRGEEQASHVYHDALGFSVTLPTALASSSSDTLWSVDSSYKYTAQGPGKEIWGTKFTIPKSLAAGTNLSSDSYVSIEHLPPGSACDATAFMSYPGVKSTTVREGVRTYSVASTTDAAVGNRYEEWVYAIPSSSPCLAVRYYIHYAAIENFPPGAVKEFDKAALMDAFDQIRRTLAR